VIGVGGLWAFPARPAHADTRTLVGIATGEGVRVTYTVPNYLLVSTLFDGAGPLAQSSLNTSGTAVGFASLPYPGDTAVNAPGLLAVATGKGIPVSYPAFVQAAYPVTPKASTQDPSGQYSLQATADLSRVTGTASVLAGPASSPVSGARAATSVTADQAGKMVATADSDADGLTFGNGVLRIGSIHTHSVTTYLPGAAAAVTKTTTLVAGATVANQAVGFGPDGVTALGQPAGSPSPVTDALNNALKSAGVSVRAASPTDVAGGKSLSGLEITSVQQVPVPGSPTGTFVYDFGNTLTAITLGAAVPDVPGISVGTASAAGGAGDGATATSAPAGNVAGSPSVDANGPTVAPPAATSASPRSSSGPARAVPGAGSTRVLLARDLRSTMRTVYAILGIAGALLLSSSALWRSRGVGASWMP
jgi:hypothetical protein